MSLRVLIVVGDPVAGPKLRQLISNDGVEIVGETEDGHRAAAEARDHRPDVIILACIPASGVGESVQRVLSVAPQGRALVLTDREDSASVREAFGAGASGYLLKGADRADVLAAVRALASGQSYMDPGLGARLISDQVRHRAHSDGAGLTRRQREVLRLLALGHTNQKAAETLALSVRTVETHRAHVMQKLRISSRAEMVRYALEHGLLDDA
jgi:two-component system response regulator NreC